MHIFEKFSNEQIAAFADCKSKEAFAAKAKELGIEVSEEDIAAAMALIAADAPSGELDDDALDAVAGGKTDKNKDGYVKVKKNDECLCGKYEVTANPIHDNTNGGRHCGTCKHCLNVRGNEICTQMKF